MIEFFNSLILWYGLLALTHLFNQINLAHTEYLKHHKEEIDENYNPNVAIVIPSYNEDYPSLKKCIESCIHQDYKNLKIFLVDDGSKDPTVFYKIKEEFKNYKKFSAVILEKNKGKRHAQLHAFNLIKKNIDIIITIDSDTIIAKKGIRKIIQKFRDPKVGAISGHVRAIRTKKLLTKLIDGRYWAAFNQERAAQSLFGTVLCCGGPFSAYRNKIIRKVKKKYISQKFLGKKCTYGDDRHLTNLVLGEGYKVKYEPKAHAITGVPNTLKGFLKQQIRWNKSFYRELLWTIWYVIKKPKNFHPYILYDLFIQTFLPLLLITSLFFHVIMSVISSPLYLLGYLVIVLGVAMLRTSYGMYRTKERNLLLFPIYSFLHVFLLIPIRLYSIATLRITKWGTR
jgi:hyaluronan synthase/N-acetylglucosaminyltransferase